MFDNYCRTQLKRLFDPADIRINGSRPWDIRIHRPIVFRRAITEGNLGLGESYMEGLLGLPRPWRVLFPPS